MQSAILAWRQGLLICDSDLEDPVLALPSLPSSPICSSGQSEDLSITVDGPDHDLTQPRPSSPAASISIAFDRTTTRAPRPRHPRSDEELRTEVRRLKLTRKLLQRKLDKSKAKLDAMETYRKFLMKQVMASYTTSSKKMDLQQQSPRRRRSRRPVPAKLETSSASARYFVYPRDFEGHFAAGQRDKECVVAKEAAKKAARKVAEGVAHEAAQLQEAIRTRVFSNTLSSYKRKNDLIVLSGALGLKTAGTVVELKHQIKSYLSSHPEVQLDARFSGLFSQVAYMWTFASTVCGVVELPEIFINSILLPRHCVRELAVI